MSLTPSGSSIRIVKSSPPLDHLGEPIPGDDHPHLVLRVGRRDLPLEDVEETPNDPLDVVHEPLRPRARLHRGLELRDPDGPARGADDAGGEVLGPDGVEGRAARGSRPGDEEVRVPVAAAGAPDGRLESLPKKGMSRGREATRMGARSHTGQGAGGDIGPGRLHGIEGGRGRG